jgi:hypothetical protein
MSPTLSRREREIMDVLHREGELPAAAIQKALLAARDGKLDKPELDRIARMIAQAARGALIQ